MEEGKWFGNKLYEIATKYFHKVSGLFSSLVLVGIISLSIYHLIPSATVTTSINPPITSIVPEISFLEYMKAVFFIEVIIFLYWVFYSYYYPKRSKNRLGIVFAIHVVGFEREDNLYYKKNFLARFKDQVHELNLPFDILVLKNHQSEKVDTVEDAKKVLKKSNAQFCVWGYVVKKKRVSGLQNYSFSLKGIVIHKPIQEVQKILLQKEFNQLLPSSIAFEENLQFEGFSFQAGQLFTAVDYITGRAALLSGDFNTAIILHEPLVNIIGNENSLPVNKEALKKLLSLEYNVKGIYQLYNSDPNYNDSFEKSLKYNPSNYSSLLNRAIKEFDNGKGDPKKALATIKMAKQYAKNDYTWLYNEIFLCLWMEKYPEALRLCQKLRAKSFDGEQIVLKSVEKFNENLLKNYNKPQLFFWLGFLNFVKKGNLSQADKYFQLFTEKSSDSMNILNISVNGYIAHIKNEIKY